jgi:AraC-like DNA-binding protein
MDASHIVSTSSTLSVATITTTARIQSSRNNTIPSMQSPAILSTTNNNNNHQLPTQFIPYYASGNMFMGVPKRGKRIIRLSEDQLQASFQYPQHEAAKRLGVSVSTLKRRFYELYGGTRWPFKENRRRLVLKESIHYILNEKNMPTKDLDKNALYALMLAFQSSMQH